MDIAIDYTTPSSPTFGDITVSDGDLVVTSTQVLAIAQDAVQRIKTFFGEWFLNNTLGMPYFQQIFVKNPNRGDIDALYINELLGVPGVIGLNSFRQVLDDALRALSLTFSAQTTDGQVDYSGSVQV
jgi:hypothetical protein